MASTGSRPDRQFFATSARKPNHASSLIGPFRVKIVPATLDINCTTAR
jgi:hypothetical protein